MSGNKTPEHMLRKYKKPFIINKRSNKLKSKQIVIKENNLPPPIIVEPSHHKLQKVDPIIISKQIPTAIRTIVLIGIGRSCTSLTAAIIDGLGVPMDESKDGHFERRVFKNWDMKRIILEIGHLNKSHEIWGTQLLANREEIKNICLALTDPHLIIVFRDIISNSQRMVTSKDMKKSPLEIVNFILGEQKKLLLITELGYPTMLLSCERLRYEPELIIDHLCGFMQIKGNKQKALDRIGNGYLIQ